MIVDLRDELGITLQHRPLDGTCAVPSSFGSARMSRAAISKYMSFSKPLAAITSHMWLITSSPWVVTFIFTTGL